MVTMTFRGKGQQGLAKAINILFVWQPFLRCEDPDTIGTE